MPETLQLAIDPYLLCLPNPCNSPEQIEGFVNSLVGWNGMLRRNDINVLVADSARIALLDDGEYPHYHILRELLRRHNYDAVDHPTISRLVQNLLDRTPSLEEFYGVNAILIDEKQTSVTPRLIVDRLKGKTRSAFIEMLVIVSMEKQASDQTTRGFIVIASTMEEGDGIVEPTDIQIDSVLHEWTWTCNARHVLPSLPVTVSAAMPLATCHSSLLRQLGIWEVWKHATDNAAAVEAVELCLAELVASGVSDQSLARFQLGPQFLESARNWGFGSRSDYARLLVESCARIVLNIPKHPIEPFRESNDSSIQRRRDDKALAFRTHLTKKGAGFRLMLWKLTDGSFEFANVGDKDELIIR